eukprot:TRINITY_DN30390_c0_g1_i1.p1 TRINITY_DN30390_c0_g1~~TRINITY_DN30390_c0_g1_i1.p1  ORF type:complete len:823 (-),score=111.24 TRINITY_DN30390_c0_g1_i1:96-2564(-)
MQPLLTVDFPLMTEDRSGSNGFRHARSHTGILPAAAFPRHMRRRRRILGPLLGLGAASFGILASLARGTSETAWISSRFERPSWLLDGKDLPLLVALFVFGSFTVLDLLAVLVLQILPDLFDRCGPRIWMAIKAHACVALCCAIHYAFAFFAEAKLMVGDHMILRNVVWINTTPVEWYIFAVIFTVSEKGSWADSSKVYFFMNTTHIFTMILVFATSRPLVLGLWILTCCSFALMTQQIFQCCLLEETKVVAKRLRTTCVILWSAYPLLHAARRLGFISPWFEQVVAISIVDVLTKAATFVAILLSRFMVTISSINTTLQLVLASNDVIVVVDQAFVLTDRLRSIPFLTNFFNDDDAEKSLLSMCINEEHQDRLWNAARVADMQPYGAPSPTCIVAFQVRNGQGQVRAECIVSKCFSVRPGTGTRIVGIAVASMSYFGPTIPRQGCSDVASQAAGSESVMILHSQSQQALPKSVNGANMQLLLALHNCTHALRLPPGVSMMVRNILLEPSLPRALFLCDPTATEVSVVAASEKFSTIFPALSVPQSLTGLFPGDCVRRIIAASALDDLFFYEKEGVELRVGLRVTFSVLPLNHLSLMDTTNLALRFGVLLIDALEQKKDLDGPWTSIADQLDPTGLNSSWSLVKSLFCSLPRRPSLDLHQLEQHIQQEQKRDQQIQQENQPILPRHRYWYHVAGRLMLVGADTSVCVLAAVLVVHCGSVWSVFLEMPEADQSYPEDVSGEVLCSTLSESHRQMRAALVVARPDLDPQATDDALILAPEDGNSIFATALRIEVPDDTVPEHTRSCTGLSESQDSISLSQHLDD